MKKLIFLLILLLSTSLVSSCSVTEDSRLIEWNCDILDLFKKEEQEPAEQKLTPQRRMEIAKSRQAALSEYAKENEIYEEELRKQEIYDKEQKYKRFKEEWVKFIQNEDGSLKNKTTQEVKKLVDQWNYYWTDHLIERMGQEWVIQNAEEVFNLEIFYKIFGKPWKTQFIEDSYVLWYVCKDGNALMTVGDVFDDGLVLIRNLNIL